MRSRFYSQRTRYRHPLCGGEYCAILFAYSLSDLSMTSRTSRSRSYRSVALMAVVAAVLLAVGFAAYYFGAFERLFGSEQPYRDPLLDTFEQRTVPGDPSSEGAFRVGEPGTVPPRTAATTTGTTTDAELNDGDSAIGSESENSGADEVSERAL
jgi:hypothetical protein